MTISLYRSLQHLLQSAALGLAILIAMHIAIGSQPVLF